MNIRKAYMVPHPPLIIPAVGRGQEKGIQKTIDSYTRVGEEIKQINPDTIVITSPHSIMYRDYFHISPGDSAVGSFAQFRAPEETFQVKYDSEFTNHLTTLAEQNDVAAGFLGERDASLDHGTMVPLYFIQKACGKEFASKFVRIGLSGYSFEEHYKLGQLIQKTAIDLDRTVVFIASGDLSHRLTKEGPYGYKKEGPEYDKKIMEYASNADFMHMLLMKEEFCELAGECGQRSFCIMAGALDGMEVKAEKLSYEGPFGVGYGIVSFEPMEWNENRKFLEAVMKAKSEQRATRKEMEDSYVKLARKALEEYVLYGRKITVPDELPQELYQQRAGCFVSLKINGRLRGCIGTIAPTKESLAKEIIENAISAATRDPRFDQVTEDELESLEYSVDVLKEPEMIESPEELDVIKYGVIVSKDVRRGLLLPNLEGVDTVEDQIQIAKQKAGIDPDETVKLERFEVVRHF